jgi:hypothetical protein
MKGDLKKQFNQEVDNYRRALLYHARSRDWETFKAKAAEMFDYVEAIEYSELERRFFTNFFLVLAVLIAIIGALFQVDFAVSPELAGLKNTMVLAGIGVSSFELFFYFNYRVYMKVKADHYTERREKFIRGIEQDFQSYVLETEVERKAA